MEKMTKRMYLYCLKIESPNCNYYFRRSKVCEIFSMDSDTIKMYRTDWFGEPTTSLKNDNERIEKQLKDKDLIIIAGNEVVMSCEQLKLHVYKTITGYPEDCTLVDELLFPEEITLNELKEKLFQLPQFYDENKTFAHLRLRERTKMFGFGKIYRENKTLRKLNLLYDSEIVGEVLDRPEELSSSAIALYICARNVAKGDNELTDKTIFDAGPTPNIDHLYMFCIEKLKKEWPVQKVTLAKYIPHSFEWKVIEDLRPEHEKGTYLNYKSAKNIAGIYDLRKKPTLLRDGDLICIRNEDENPNQNDDFHSPKDLEARIRYQNLKSAQKSSQPRIIRKERQIRIAEF